MGEEGACVAAALCCVIEQPLPPSLLPWQLHELGALDHKHGVTQLGRDMAMLPLEPVSTREEEEGRKGRCGWGRKSVP